MRRFGFPRGLRVRKRGDYLRVQRKGEKHHMRNFLVFAANVDGNRALQAPLPAKLGVTVTRKVGGAVVRNKIKRVVREAFRRERAEFPAGLEMVWVAKRNAANVRYVDVHREMRAVSRRFRSVAARGSQR